MREGGVTPPALPLSTDFGQIFKDDVNGFSSTWDICFMTIRAGSVQCACVNKYWQAGHDQIGRPIGYLGKEFVVCTKAWLTDIYYYYLPICVNHTIKQ